MYAASRALAVAVAPLAVLARLAEEGIGHASDQRSDTHPGGDRIVFGAVGSEGNPQPGLYRHAGSRIRPTLRVRHGVDRIHHLRLRIRFRQRPETVAGSRGSDQARP